MTGGIRACGASSDRGVTVRGQVNRRNAAEGKHRGRRRDGYRRPTGDQVGGLTVIEVPSREEAHKWAAKWAAACRCDQEI